MGTYKHNIIIYLVLFVPSFSTWMPASVLGPLMYSYCSTFRVKLSPKAEPVKG